MRDFFKRLLTRGKAFWQIDKVTHMVTSALICFVIGAYMIVRLGPWMYDAVVVPYIFSAVATFFIGLFKECYDHYFGGTSEGVDLIADAWGIFLGLLLMTLTII